MSKESNARRLAEIENRLKRTHDTPWSVAGDAGIRRGGCVLFEGVKHPCETDRGNADFVANARDDVPWLVARVKQLEAALAGGFRARTSDVDLDPIDEE